MYTHTHTHTYIYIEFHSIIWWTFFSKSLFILECRLWEGINIQIIDVPYWPARERASHRDVKCRERGKVQLKRTVSRMYVLVCQCMYVHTLVSSSLSSVISLVPRARCQCQDSRLVTDSHGRYDVRSHNRNRKYKLLREEISAELPRDYVCVRAGLFVPNTPEGERGKWSRGALRETKVTKPRCASRIFPRLLWREPMNRPVLLRTRISRQARVVQIVTVVSPMSVKAAT